MVWQNQIQKMTEKFRNNNGPVFAPGGSVGGGKVNGKYASHKNTINYNERDNRRRNRREENDQIQENEPGFMRELLHSVTPLQK